MGRGLEVMIKGVVQQLNASGRVSLESQSYWTSWRISILLMFKYGFKRKGVYIPPVTDESIYPDYIKEGVKIYSGWDNWTEYYWSADNEEADRFLKKFYDKHCE